MNRLSTEEASILGSESPQPQSPLRPDLKKPMPFELITGGIKPSHLRIKIQHLLLRLPLAFCLFTTVFLCIPLFLIEPHPSYAGVSGIITQVVKRTCYSKPYESISIIPERQECPSGYEQLTLGTFRGTISGCYSNNILFASRCNYFLEGQGVARIIERPFKVWRSRKFCGKLSAITSNSADIMRAETCPSQMKACKRIGYNLCIKANQSCPITSIKIVSASEIANYTNLGFTKQQIDEDHFLVYENNENVTNPITGFNISLNDKPCLDPGLAPKRTQPNKTSYPLMKAQELGCGSMGANNDTSFVDSLPERTVFEQNDLLPSVMSLPFFSEYMNGQEYKLFTISTAAVKDDPACNFCSKSEQLLLAAGRLSSYVKYYNLYLVFLVLNLGLQMFMIFYNYRSYKISKYQPTVYKGMFWRNMIFYAASVVFFAIQSYEIQQHYSTKSEDLEALQKLEKANCFQNPQIDKLLDLISNNVLENSVWVINSCRVVQFIACVLSVIICLIHYMLKKLIDNDKDTPHLEDFEDEEEDDADGDVNVDTDENTAQLDSSQ